MKLEITRITSLCSFLLFRDSRAGVGQIGVIWEEAWECSIYRKLLTKIPCKSLALSIRLKVTTIFSLISFACTDTRTNFICLAQNFRNESLFLKSRDFSKSPSIPSDRLLSMWDRIRGSSDRWDLLCSFLHIFETEASIQLLVYFPDNAFPRLIRGNRHQ